MSESESQRKKHKELESGSLPVDLLSMELLEKGEGAFRQQHDHAFLVLLHEPPKKSDWIDPVTDEASIPGIKVRRRAMSGLVAVPVRKSDRNAFRSKITVGRARNNDIIIRSPKVSKLHGAMLLDESGNYRYQDLGSLNGTVLNGRKVDRREQVLLKDGDLISIWRYVFEFQTLQGFIAKLRELHSSVPPRKKPTNPGF